MKIFVTGFQRSGTTLLRDLIEKHPDVKIMFHETGLLKNSKKRICKSKVLPQRTTRSERSKNKKLKRKIKVNIGFDMRNDNWGEKIPYYHYKIRKGVNINVINYCNRWNDYFLPDARILHIVRHPMDMAISTLNIGYVNKVLKPIRILKKSFPAFMYHSKRIKNIKHIKYEQLICHPRETLRNIFKFCNLDCSDEILDQVLESDIHNFGFINKDRAFNYKNTNVELKKFSLKKIVNLMNEIPGPKYEWKDEDDDKSGKSDYRTRRNRRSS